MGYCPYIYRECPQNTECELWDTEALQCGVVRQKNVLQQILATGGETSVLSLPPTGKYKLNNIYYDANTDEHVVIREDTPA